MYSFLVDPGRRRTLEERILDMQQRKARLADTVITVGDGHLPMDMAELENLITDAAPGRV